MDATGKACWVLANIGLETRRKNIQMINDDICLQFFVIFNASLTQRVSIRGTGEVVFVLSAFALIL
jgi:hypothetical protein